MELEQIGKYKIVAKIGQGAMGEVWKAHDPVLNRHVAIKTMSGGGADETLRKRFQREAQSAAGLNHPNIITVYDYGEEQGQIYMAMELLEGADLKEVISKQALNDLFDKLDIIEQICDGLAYAHTHDVVHRDLKPGNIHIQRGGQVKILDFGLARLGASADMTKSGMILGTPNYMSPEQVRGEKADARSDIFSLGAVFYELLTNRKPFDADSLHAVLFNVLQQEPQPVRKWVPDVPGPLVDIVEKALCKDPSDRFQDAASMREAMRGVRRQLAQGWVGEPTIAEPADRLIEETLGAAAPAPASRSSLTPRPAAHEIEGTAALDPVRASAVKSGLRSASGSTLSGRSPTQVEGSIVVPVSRIPLYVGGVLGLAGIVAVAVMMLRPAPKPPANEQNNALAQALAGTQVELARRNLEDKDFKGAIAQGQRALQVDPHSAEAKEIVAKAQATLKELDAAAAETRAALDAGDADKASKALARVLAIDPKHPLAAELSQQLGSRFRGQAEEARKAMGKSRGAAEKAKAASLPPFAEAQTLDREAEALFAKADFTGAAQRFMAARDGYDRALRSAQDAAHTPAPTLPPTTMAAATLPPVTAPPTTVPPATAPPPTQAPATVPPATAPPATAPTVVTDEAAVRRIVLDYGRAIETKDLALFRAIKPNLSSEEEGRLREAFAGIQSQQVNITIQSVQIAGAQAVVKVSRRDVINGNPVSAIQQTLTLVKAPAGWTIKQIGR